MSMDIKLDLFKVIYPINTDPEDTANKVNKVFDILTNKKENTGELLEPLTTANNQKGIYIKVYGFTCIKDGSVKEIMCTAAQEEFIECSDGKHFLDGQLDDNGNYVGCFLV